MKYTNSLKCLLPVKNKFLAQKVGNKKGVEETPIKILKQSNSLSVEPFARAS